MSSSIIEQIRIQPGAAAALPTRDTRDQLGLADKAEGAAILAGLQADLGGLLARLWAEDRRSVLLVLQGMDASGKDGTIRRVLGGSNPQGVRVEGFRRPSTNELDHDYLWRVHQRCPRRGELGIFNRSHYEDVVTVGVLSIASWEVARRRTGHINAFEQMLVDEGTNVVKVFLHLSRDEQRERLQDRIDDPARHWKFSLGDLDVRAQWDDFMTGWDEALGSTSTPHAPWHVVPADRRWVRDVAVATVLVDALRQMDPQVPPPDDALKGLIVSA